MPKFSRKSLLALLLLGSLVVSGCNGLGFLGYAFARKDSKKVPAEYDLANSSVLVVLYVDQATLYEYPYARLEVATLLNDELKKNVKNCDVKDCRSMIKYQDENISWDSMDRTALGKMFNADYVLLVSLPEFATREPGSIDLARGRLTAEASLYKCSLPEREARVWKGQDIRIVFPTSGPVASNGDDSKIRYNIEKKLADKLARKFYNHEVAADPNDE